MRATGYCDGSRDKRHLPAIYNTLCSKLSKASNSVLDRSHATSGRGNGPCFPPVRAGRRWCQPPAAVILPDQAAPDFRFPWFAACRMAKTQLVAKAICGVGVPSICWRPPPPQCLRFWLCITGRSSGPPPAGRAMLALYFQLRAASWLRPLSFNVVQQANPSSKSRGRLRVWRDDAEQFPQRFASSVVTPPVSGFASRDFAGSGKVGHTLFLVRDESLSLQPACRLGRSPHGCGSDVQFLHSIRGAFNMAPHNRSLQRTASPHAELQRYGA